MTDTHMPAGKPLLKRPTMLAALAVAFLGIVYSGAWLYLASSARTAALAWADGRRAQGYAVGFDAIAATGFPFTVGLDVEGPTFGVGAGSAAWRWQGERLDIAWRPWDSSRVRAETAGAQSLVVGIGGAPAVFSGTLGSLRIDAGWDGGAVTEAVLAVRDLALEREGGGGRIAVLRADLDIRRPVLGPADERTATVILSAELEGGDFSAVLASPLGGTVRRFDLKARLMGGLAAGHLADALAEWRDIGGTVEIEHLAAVHGPLSLSAGGTVALDGDLQPIGALTAKATGFLDTIDALARFGLIGARDAITAKMVLGVMSRSPEGGGPASLNLALTLQQRRLYAGPVALFAWPVFGWPDIALP